MGRVSSCWDAFVCLLILLTSAADRTVVWGTVIFPNTESCKLNTGEQGSCVPLPDCPSVLQTFKQHPPVSCGFQDFTQIVCCPVNQDTTKDKLVDISPPPGYDTLDCGKSAVKIEGFEPFGLSLSSVSVGRAKRANVIPVEKGIGLFKPPVVGGEISERAAWPWVALLGQRDAVGINWFCGGVLINEHWVLSALHCFHDFNADVVRLGEHDYNNNTDGADHEDIPVAQTILYPDYNFPQGYHDLALLRLERKVILQEFIKPVCLPWGRKSEENIVNTKALVVGWGHTLYGGLPSSVLREADVQVFPSSRCDSSYSTLGHYANSWPRGIGEETLCAGDPDGGKDSCKGDSGGPLVTRGSLGRYVAAGIVSQGFGCGHKDFPGLYVNLRHPAYLAWIKNVAFGLQ